MEWSEESEAKQVSRIYLIDILNKLDDYLSEK